MINLNTNVDRFVRLFFLAALAVVSFIVVFLVPTIANKFHLPGGPFVCLYFLFVAALIFSRRDSLQLKLDRASNLLSFTAANMWKRKILAEEPLNSIEDVLIRQKTQSFEHTRQEWYIIEFKQNGHTERIQTVAYPNDKQAYEIKSKISDFLESGEPDMIEFNGKESLLGVVVFALLGFFFLFMP